MASIKNLFEIKEKELLSGEIFGRSDDKYIVNLKDRTVIIKSSLSEILSQGTRVFVADIDNELRIIAKSDVKTRDAEVVVVNG